MTKELEVWKGEFGDEYTERNAPDEKVMEYRKNFWGGLFATLPVQSHNEPQSILEVGANVGANLVALEQLYKLHQKTMDFYAVEINQNAKNILKQQDIRSLKILDGHAGQIECSSASMDIVITCGVLIHVNPDSLRAAMSEIHRVSRRFIICAEYFSPEPRALKYRGEDGLLWTRDFGNEWLNNFPGLRCIGYSFAWKRFTGMDNVTWWIFEKVN